PVTRPQTSVAQPATSGRWPRSGPGARCRPAWRRTRRGEACLAPALLAPVGDGCEDTEVGTSDQWSNGCGQPAGEPDPRGAQREGVEKGCKGESWVGAAAARAGSAPWRWRRPAWP